MAETEETAPSCDIVSHHVIPTERVGALSVWVQGDLSLAQNKDTRDTVCVFLTAHDVGSNHHAWLRFANSPAMAEIREKAVFLHVDLLGQEDGADEIKSFPSMQEIGEDLVNILDTLRVKVVIGLGEGAGANIMLRFGAMHVTRCLGVVCINPNEVAMSMLDSLMDRVKNMRVGSKPLTSDQKQMNQNNVAKFAGAFLNRSDVIPIVENRCPAKPCYLQVQRLNLRSRVWKPFLDTATRVKPPCSKLMMSLTLWKKLQENWPILSCFLLKVWAG